MPYTHVQGHTRQGKPVRSHGRNIKERTAVALRGNESGGDLSSIARNTAILGGLALAAILQFAFSLTITILVTATTVMLALLTWEATKKRRRSFKFGNRKSKYATRRMIWKLQSFKAKRWLKRRIGKHRESWRQRRRRSKPGIMRRNGTTATMGYVTAKSARLAAERSRRKRVPTQRKAPS